MRLFHCHLDEIYVQTRWVQKELTAFFKKSIQVRPIVPERLETNSLSVNEKSIDFIAVSGQVDYKNLCFLLRTWGNLAQLKSRHLLLVVDALSKEQAKIVADLRQKGCQISVQTQVARDEIYKLYSASRFLLMCSSIESFCLPLYESQYFNLPVIAPQLPYVLEAELKKVFFYQDLDSASFSKALLQASLELG